jgi:hypothetical protein
VVIKDWYISRHEREQRMTAIVSVANQKKELAKT